MSLFCKHGYNAVGLDQIITQAGTTKTTFYNHFESKDELILAVVRQRDRWWRGMFDDETARRAGPDPIARLRAVFDLLRDYFANDDFRGCMFINAATEFSSPHDPTHQAAKANVDAIRAAIADLADEAGIEDPEGFADKFNLIIEGTFATEIIDRANTAADTAAQLADILIDQALATSPA